MLPVARSSRSADVVGCVPETVSEPVPEVGAVVVTDAGADVAAGVVVAGVVAIGVAVSGGVACDGVTDVVVGCAGPSTGFGFGPPPCEAPGTTWTWPGTTMKRAVLFESSFVAFESSFVGFESSFAAFESSLDDDRSEGAGSG